MLGAMRVIGLSAALALASLRAALPAESYLNDDEIKALLGNTVRSGKTADGTPWTIRSNADGTQTLVAGKDNSFTDSSTYVVRDGASCETWRKLDDGKETCWRFRKTGDNTYVSVRPNGKVDSTFSVEPQ